MPPNSPIAHLIEDEASLHDANPMTDGVIHCLGINAAGTAKWVNPARTGDVTIYHSSLELGIHSNNGFIDENIQLFITTDEPNAWVCIDFLNVQVQAKRYSFSHPTGKNHDFIRNWQFQGSNDTTNGADGTWIVLMDHKNDQCLNKFHNQHTWTIPSVNQGQSFSKFRILQNGPNSGNRNYLCCCNFEIYGSVKHLPQMNFIYQHDFDSHGLLYFLGTLGGTQKWKNPMSEGLVHVSSSSLGFTSKPLSSIVGRSTVRCLTKSTSINPWFKIELPKNIQIKLSHYTIRHYKTYNLEALRSWKLQGSNNGQGWITISIHENDNALQQAGQSHTWEVNCPQFFQHFRILMTDKNSNGHWYLCCSGIELYGIAKGEFDICKLSALCCLHFDFVMLISLVL